MAYWVFMVSKTILDLLHEANRKKSYDSNDNKVLKRGEKGHFRLHHILKPY